MLLEIRHVTEYHYAGPVRESVMELWMQPQKGGSQRLVSFELDVDPPARLFSYADSFGNAVYHFDVPQPHTSLRMEARSAVETAPRVDMPAALDQGEWDRLRSSFVLTESFEFLRPHGYAVETEALRAFVEKRGLNDLRRPGPGPPDPPVALYRRLRRPEPRAPGRPPLGAPGVRRLRGGRPGRRQRLPRHHRPGMRPHP